MMKQKPATLEEHIAELEKTLMTGRGRWIADFSESRKNARISDVEFEAVIEGNTRVKGFLLSRLFSFLANPNYEVCCFILGARPGKGLDLKSFTKALAAIRSHMKKKEVKWSWLFIFTTEGTNNLKDTVQKMDDQAIGVVLADLNSEEVFHSNSYLGKQAKRFIKI